MAENITKEIIDAKFKLDECLKQFLQDYSLHKSDSSKIQLLVNQLVQEHTLVINTINNSIGRVHQNFDFYYSPDIKNDYVATVEDFIPTSFRIVSMLSNITTIHNLRPIQHSQNTYITLQKLINTFSSKTTRDKLFQDFTSKGMSTAGFNQKFKRVKNKELRLQLFIGIPLLILSIALIFSGEYFLGKPFNGIQLISLKALIALTISIVGSSLIEGSVKTNWSLQKGLSIRAIGWVAIFLLIYFLNPANPGDVH